MESVSKWLLTNAEKDEFIATLSANLPALRAQAEISQEELANLVGISRQTYCAVERNIRRMSWSTYLSLVFFFDHNQKTHKMIHQLSIFPQELIMRFNNGLDCSDFGLDSIFGNNPEEIIELLDEQAKGAIRAVIMMEYTRCTVAADDAVIKSLSGRVAKNPNSKFIITKGEDT